MFDIASERYMSCNRTTIMVRVPGCKQRNFHKSKVQDAIKVRNLLCVSVGIDPYSKSHSPSGRIHSKPHADKKSDLPVGICLSSYTKTLGDGSVQTYQRVIALGLPGSNTKSKSFSVMTYGKDQAISLAIAWRERSQPYKSRKKVM